MSKDIKILHVDDDSRWLDMAAIWLRPLIRDHSIQLISVLSVAEAESEINQGGIDAVISDGLNGGWEEVLVFANEAENQIPFILLSSDYSFIDAAHNQGLKALQKAEAYSKAGLAAILVDLLDLGE